MQFISLYERIIKLVDRISKEKRSWIMSRIRSNNTSPEVIVRSFLHASGLRFRIHRKDLPGNPDIVLSRIRTVIFIHGCFWHQCTLCRAGKIPKTNLSYWLPKLQRNTERDQKNIIALQSEGWNVIIIWACQINQIFLHHLVRKLSRIGNQKK